jgi:hypothetical protein
MADMEDAHAAISKTKTDAHASGDTSHFNSEAVSGPNPNAGVMENAVNGAQKFIGSSVLGKSISKAGADAYRKFHYDVAGET